MSHVVVLAGGSPHAHDFAATGAELAVLAADAGHAVTLTADPDEAAEMLSQNVAALIFDGLWWRMLGDAYDQWRDRYGYSPSAATRAALIAFVHDGGGLLALHTAPICFDDWPAWGDVVGGAWQLGRVVTPGTENVAGSRRRRSPDRRRDRSRHSRSPTRCMATSPSVTTSRCWRSATATTATPTSQWCGHTTTAPDVWCTTAFGHDALSIRHPDHARLITQALAWVTEKTP